jgi:hypothetical protein
MPVLAQRRIPTNEIKVKGGSAIREPERTVQRIVDIGQFLKLRVKILDDKTKVIFA